MAPHYPKQRCRARMRKGRRCRKWAMRGKTYCNNHDPHRKQAVRPGNPPCRARTRAGEPCRNRVAGGEGAGANYCHVHLALEAPESGPAQRCSARHADGQRCRKWALRPAGDPPLCATHDRGVLPQRGDARRCRGMTVKGTRCRNWATVASWQAGRPRCHQHSGHYRRPRPGERQCTATTVEGKRCPSWALPETLESGRPLCNIHARGSPLRVPGAADDAAGKQCTATTLSGTRCRNWALRDTVPPLCWGHAYPGAHARIRHGYYRQRRTPEEALAAEVAARAAPVGSEEVAAEVAALRVRMRGMLAYLAQPGLAPGQRQTVYRLLLRATRMVGALLREGVQDD